MPTLQLFFGCFGQAGINNFVSCHGVDNCLLNMDKNLKIYEKLSLIMDQYNLYDSPIYDLNKIKSFIFKIQNECGVLNNGLWNPQEFMQYQQFLMLHKNCGIYIKLTQIGKSQHLLERPISKITNKPITEPAKIFIQGRGANQWRQDKNKTKN